MPMIPLSHLITLVSSLAFITVLFLLIRNISSGTKKMKEMKERIEEEINRRRDIEHKYDSEIHYIKSLEKSQEAGNENGPGNESSNQLLIEEISKIRQEKEEEMQLRMEMEKQVELTLQKTDDIKRRMDDWKVVQNLSLNESKETIIKVGHDLYNKLTEHFHKEIYQGSQKTENIIKNVSNNLSRIIKQVQFLTKARSEGLVKIATSSLDKEEFGEYSHEFLENIFTANGLVNKEDYLMGKDLSVEDKKIFSCEAITISKNRTELLIIDGKSSKIFNQLSIDIKNQDKPYEELIANFSNKIINYVKYLIEPKYKSSHIDFLKNKQIFANDPFTQIVMFLPSENALAKLREIDPDYVEKLWTQGIIPASPIGMVNLLFHNMHQNT